MCILSSSTEHTMSLIFHMGLIFTTVHKPAAVQHRLCAWFCLFPRPGTLLKHCPWHLCPRHLPSLLALNNQLQPAPSVCSCNWRDAILVLQDIEPVKMAISPLPALVLAQLMLTGSLAASMCMQAGIGSCFYNSLFKSGSVWHCIDVHKVAAHLQQ